MNKDILAAVCESPLKFDHFEIIKRIKSKWSAHVWTEQNLVFKNVLEMLSLKCWQSGVPHFKGILVTLPFIYTLSKFLQKVVAGVLLGF